MGFDALKIKRSNTLIYALMAFQLALLTIIGVILLLTVSDLGMITAASTTIMFLVGLPMLILLYASSSDKILKTTFWGLTADILFLTTSGILWYVVSGALGMEWLVPIAKVLMVVAYLPFIYALFVVYKARPRKLNPYAKFFIGFVNVSCALAIIFFVLAHQSPGNSFNALIYTLSLIGDLTSLALLAMLIIIYPRRTHRYVFSSIFCFTLLSLAGDSLNLVDAMKWNIQSMAMYSNYFYDSMLLFTVVSLLIYLVFREFSRTNVDEINKRLDNTRQAMNDLIMQMPDAACFCDVNGVATMVNDRFLRIFGGRREDTIGKFRLFDHDEFLECDLGQKIPLLRKGEMIQIEMFPMVSRNRQMYLSMKLFPTFSRDREISGYVALVEDITERVQAEEELKRAKGLAELYIDLMSHDINNMNQVGMGYLEIALDTLAIQDEKKHLLTKPLEFLGNSSRLIDNVKKLRRASEGDAYLRPVDLGKVLKGVIAEQGQAPGREVSIEYDVAENALVKANELLKDVFVNLVSNSIKHSSGAVTIMIRQEAAVSGGKKYYRVAVEDNGPGIADDLKPVIFDRLLRGRGKNGGSGLGLYLVKALIDSYGGTIAVEDRVPGDWTQGARFVIMLPDALSD